MRFATKRLTDALWSNPNSFLAFKLEKLKEKKLHLASNTVSKMIDNLKAGAGKLKHLSRKVFPQRL